MSLSETARDGVLVILQFLRVVLYFVNGMRLLLDG